MDLLSNATATGAAVVWPGGPGLFSASGTFSGATVSLQFLTADGTTWADCGAETTLTAAGGGIFLLPSGKIRAAVTGSPSGMYAVANPIART